MAWHYDAILSGPPVIDDEVYDTDELGIVGIRVEFVLVPTGTQTDRIFPISNIKIEVFDAGGVSVFADLGAVVVESGPGFARFRGGTNNIALDALDPTQVYRAVVTGLVGTLDPNADPPAAADGTEQVLRFAFDVYPLPFPVRYPLIGSRYIALNYPMLTPPAAIGSWYPQCARAHYELIMWVVQQRRGQLWTLNALTIAAEHLTLHYIWKTLAAYGSVSALANAAESLTAYSLALKDVQLGWDVDGDGDLDEVRGAAGSAVDAAVVV